jgi:DNA-binding MarR family transcriptional regulator
VRDEELREIHDLMLSTIGLFHEKFLHQFRKDSRHHTGVKKNHVKIIGLLYLHASLTATEMARMLNMEKGSLTTLIDQLEESGLVRRCEDFKDRRKCLISLTDEGQKEMEDILGESIRRMGGILAGVEPRELQAFIASLRYVTEFMQKI